MSNKALRRFAAPTLVALVILAGCGSSDELGGTIIADGIGCAPTSIDRRTDDVPEVEAIPDTDKVGEEVETKDLTEGKGCGTDTGSLISIDLVGANGSDGKVFTSTYEDAQPIAVSLGSGTLIPGLEEKLADMKVGGRRQFIIPPKLGYGSAGNPEQGIGKDETLIFVVDLLAVSNTPVFTDPPETCKPATDIPAGLEGSGKPTEVKMPDVAPKGEKVNTVDLEEGSGDSVKAGDAVELNYLGISCTSGKQFDSSWDRGETLPATIGQGTIDGFGQGIEGMKVGGLRQIEIPPNLGYGEAGQPPDIAPNDPLVFIIELVSVADPTATTTVPGTPADPGQVPVPDVSGEAPGSDGGVAATTVAEAPATTTP